MADKLNLLATFIQKEELETTLQKIKEYFKDQEHLKIFQFKNIDDETKLILTYTVTLDDSKIFEYSKAIPGTINLHRKKETNTIYSINALNYIVELETGKKEKNSNYQIQWENYKNCVIISQKGVGFVKIRIELEKIIKN